MKIVKDGDSLFITDINGDKIRVSLTFDARQLIADIMAALDEPIKPDVTKHPLQNAVDELWTEKETPFTTEQKMQAVIRKAELTLLDADDDQQIVDAPFKEVTVAIVPRGFEEWYAHYQYAVRGGYIRR